MKREIETSTALEEWLASPSRSNEIVFQSLDLTKQDEAMLALESQCGVGLVFPIT